MTPLRVALLVTILFSNTAYAGDDFGRLFMTPDQRRALDQLRDPNAPRPADGDAGNPLPVGTPTDRKVLLNGVVRRQGGSDVVWVNGARAGTNTNQLVQLRRGPDQRNRVMLKDSSGTTAQLKPGQVWDMTTGRVTDCLGCTTASGDITPAADAPAAQP